MFSHVINKKYRSRNVETINVESDDDIIEVKKEVKVPKREIIVSDGESEISVNHGTPKKKPKLEYADIGRDCQFVVNLFILVCWK